MEADSLQQRRILLGISGGIAAYKSAMLCRELVRAGADVRVIMTEAATRFITPLTLQALSGHPVHSDLFEAESNDGMGHIELARWAELIIVAPATAQTLARLAHGMADDLLSAAVLASEAPLCLAPAMNHAMWSSKATQSNLGILRDRGAEIFGPADGDQACGETGLGRMLEAEEIAVLVAQLLGPKYLTGKRVVITAGPTWEAIDPVRGLSNRSSGKMGYAIARAAAMAGAEVTLVSGPTRLSTPAGVTRIDITSAQQMADAVMQSIPGCDVFIGVAAVADYRPVNPAEHKIKKGEEYLNLELVRNPDILAMVAAQEHAPYTVGFAAETRDIEQHARQKLAAKGIDLIAANPVSGDNGAFEADDNELLLIDDKNTTPLPRAPKTVLARQLIEEIARRLP